MFYWLPTDRMQINPQYIFPFFVENYNREINFSCWSALTCRSGIREPVLPSTLTNSAEEFGRNSAVSLSGGEKVLYVEIPSGGHVKESEVQGGIELTRFCIRPLLVPRQVS